MLEVGYRLQLAMGTAATIACFPALHRVGLPRPVLVAALDLYSLSDERESAQVLLQANDIISYYFLLNATKYPSWI